MGKVDLISARLLVDFTAELEGYPDPVAFGFSTDGEILAVAATSTEPRAVSGAIGTFPKSRLDDPSELLVVSWQNGAWRRLPIAAESLSVHFVQPTSNGVLLAGARCRWTRSGAEQNAVIHDRSGTPLRRFTLGDGIQDLRTTADGTIWASYFDEGVIGNFGWGRPGPVPVGQPGLVAFDEQGDIKWTYDAGDAGTDDMVDAYALNVAGPDDVWVYFYTEFSLVHISRGRYRVWRPGVSGSHALAVRENRVLLVGEYQRPSVARIIEMNDDGSTRVTRRFRLVDPDGDNLDGECLGVGPRLHLYRDRRVWMVDDW